MHQYIVKICLNIFYTKRIMNNSPSHRLRAARIKKGYKSASKASQAYGWEAATYRAHENGSRNFSADNADRYARAYSVPVEWLLLGKNPPKWFIDNDLKASEILEHAIYENVKVPVIDSKQLHDLVNEKVKIQHLMGNPSYTYINPNHYPGNTGAFVALNIIESDSKNIPALKPGDGITIDLGMNPNPGKLAVALFEEEDNYIIGRFVKKNKGDFLSFENKEGYPEDKPLNEAQAVFRVIEKRLSE